MEKIISEKTLFQGKTIRVKEYEIQLKPGMIVNWEIVDKGGDSVAVAAIDNERNIYLVEQYYAAIDSRIFSLPKGKIDSGETDFEAAQRELREEIGMKGKLRKLIEMVVSPGYLKQKTILFLATELEKHRQIGDEVEFIRPFKVPLDEAIEMIRKGKITEARTIGGIALTKMILDT